MKTYIYYVYILTTKRNTVLYTGVTNDLERRCHEHKRGLAKSFTRKYNVEKLVYYEAYDDIEHAIAREKQIKGLLRIKKEELIQASNGEWKDLCPMGRLIKPDGRESTTLNLLKEKIRLGKFPA